MNDEPLHPYIEPELEARLTALVLGEASDFEREELERLISERPELGIFRDRLEATHELLLEVAEGQTDDADSWKLSAHRRDAVLAALGETLEAESQSEATVSGKPEKVVRPRFFSGFRLSTPNAVGLSVVGAGALIAAILCFAALPGIQLKHQTEFASDRAGGSGASGDFESKLEELANNRQELEESNVATDSLALTAAPESTPAPVTGPEAKESGRFHAGGTIRWGAETAESNGPAEAPAKPAEPGDSTVLATVADEQEPSYAMIGHGGYHSETDRGGSISVPTDGSQVEADMTVAFGRVPAISGGGVVLKGGAGRPHTPVVISRNDLAWPTDGDSDSEALRERDDNLATHFGTERNRRFSAIGHGGGTYSDEESTELNAKTQAGGLAWDPTVAGHGGVESSGDIVALAEESKSSALGLSDDFGTPPRPVVVAGEEIRFPTATDGDPAGGAGGAFSTNGVVADGASEQDPDPIPGLVVTQAEPDSDLAKLPETGQTSAGLAFTQMGRAYGDIETRGNVDLSSRDVEDKNPFLGDLPQDSLLFEKRQVERGADESGESREKRETLSARGDSAKGSSVRIGGDFEGVDMSESRSLVEDEHEIAKAYNQWGFGVVGSGEEQGISEDSQNRVYREGKPIADLAVTSVEPSTPVAEIFASTIEPGKSLEEIEQLVRWDEVPGGTVGKDYEVDLKSRPDVVELDGFVVLPGSNERGAVPPDREKGNSNVDPYSTAGRRTQEEAERHRLNHYDFAYDHTRARMLREVAAGWENSANPSSTSDSESPEANHLYMLGGAPVELNYDIQSRGDALANGSETTEFRVGANFVESAPVPASFTYHPLPPTLEETRTADEPFSTFSLHVSDVSFKLAQASLAKGEWPDTNTIRPEEFVNAFDYGDAMPTQEEKVGAQIEQAIHPFLQQRNLMRISMRTAAQGRGEGTPLRLTLLLDNSGSMERADRRESVQRAFALLAGQLQPSDQVTLISFARQPRLLADRVAGDKANELLETMRNLPSEGGTNLEAALSLAFEKAKEQKEDGAQNRIVLLTDGAANLGDAEPESLARAVETMRNAGIAFDAAGVGSEGLNDEILEALTRKGDGRYYLLDRPEDADAGFARQIAGALRPAAGNVKIQVEFNPERVETYKLIGFEKHRLEKEDFRNDAVDAAEMAAEEAGVAVYQFQPKPDGEGDIGFVSVRFRDMATGEMVEKRWPIPYTPGAPRLDQAAPSMRVAATAALLASRLKEDPLGQVVELSELGRYVADLPERWNGQQQVLQLREMIAKARQIAAP